jgi:S-adenosylmethionine decarboxylase
MNTNEKLKLYGFNNLTKNLSFSFYKLHYLDPSRQTEAYNNYIHNIYSAEKLTSLLKDVCGAIGGSILNIAQQDYEPQGASVTLMISEEAKPESLVAHLDKSHICVHTYPDDNIQNNVAIFRADIELSTCGIISPLKVINYLLDLFDADVIDLDYRIRGMTRNIEGKKLYIDEDINTISHVLNKVHQEKYHHENIEILNRNIFSTKLKRKNVNTTDSIFQQNNNLTTDSEIKHISKALAEEIELLFTSAS